MPFRVSPLQKEPTAEENTLAFVSKRHCDYKSYSPSLTGSKDLSRVGSNRLLLEIFTTTQRFEHLQRELEQFQVNTKFLNSLPLEWSRFVTDHGDDPIDAINHMMSLLTSVVTSRYLTTNNQLSNSSKPRQQATINDGRVTLQPVQGRQTTFVAGTNRTYTPGTSGSNSRKQMTDICYNYKGEGHIFKQCTKPKRKRDDSWFKEKVLLVQAQANGQILHEEELAFLADPGILEVALMANLSQYGSDVLAETEPDQGKLTSIFMKDNLAEPQVHVPNVLITHPTLMMDSDFIPSDNSLPESEILYFNIEEKNSGSTTIHADISLPDLECFDFKSKPDPGELTSIIDFGIHENVLSATNVNLSPEEDHSPLFAYVVGERVFEGPEMIEVTNKKVAVAKEKLKEARTRQKSYADKHRRSLEFQPGDHVFLKVSPARGVRRFGIKGKLSLRFIGPFEILDRVGEIRADLSYVEEPEAILDRQDRVMRKKTFPFVKILWRNHPEREATWETEESIRTSYPHFLP
nr:putative nucleotidyltransferase, ribonuclease H [Tanacetum cinerariifolium]